MQHLCALFVTNLFYFLAQGLVFDLCMGNIFEQSTCFDTVYDLHT